MTSVCCFVKHKHKKTLLWIFHHIYSNFLFRFHNTKFFEQSDDLKIKGSEVMNQRKQYMKKCSDLQHYKWSLGIFLLYPLETSFETCCALCVCLPQTSHRSQCTIIFRADQGVFPVSPVESFIQFYYWSCWVSGWKQEEHEFIHVWARWLCCYNAFFSFKPTIPQKFFPWFLQVVSFFHTRCLLLSLLQKMNTFE